MPLRRENCRTFHRALYAGQMEKIQLLKRDDDQRQGVVRSEIMYNCRRSAIERTGEMIQADNQVNHRTVWHIPRIELERVKVNHLNPADRIVQLEGREKGWTWQPEASTLIQEKLFGNYITMVCLRTDPPA